MYSCKYDVIRSNCSEILKANQMIAEYNTSPRYPLNVGQCDQCKWRGTENSGLGNKKNRIYTCIAYDFLSLFPSMPMTTGLSIRLTVGFDIP
jgi:hypothetical protein